MGIKVIDYFGIAKGIFGRRRRQRKKGAGGSGSSSGAWRLAGGDAGL
ncbi:hypothetical protein [Chitinophaga agrisoli]|nr:hypothetical protein [Chitinophaga agrisoli]